MLRGVARRWPDAFLSDHHVSTFYGFLRVRLQAKVIEDVDRDAANKRCALEWTLPDSSVYQACGFGESLKKARQTASRALVSKIPEEKGQKLIPMWRQVLGTTQKQIGATTLVDQYQDGGHKIVWKLQDRELAVVGCGAGSVAELKALEALHVSAEVARNVQKAPLKVKASLARKLNWQECDLTPAEAAYYLQQENIVASRAKVKSTESTIEQSEGFVCTLEWRLIQEGKPAEQWIVTALGNNKKAARALAAKKMLEDRGCIVILSAEDRKRVNAVLNMCKMGQNMMDMRQVNASIQILPMDARDMFLVDVFRVAIAHNCIDKLVLPKQIGWKTWSQLLDEATFVLDLDVLSLLARIEVSGNFDPDASREYYQKYRYLIASERRASLRQALAGQEELGAGLKCFDLVVGDKAEPYFSLQSPSGILPDVNENDIMVIKAASIQRPVLCKVIKNAAKSHRITVKALRHEKLDLTKVSAANLESEITAIRQIEALDAFAAPTDPFGPQQRFTFFPLMRDAILALDQRDTNGRIGVVHGPPGTGKTYTACEIVKSWLDGRPTILCVTDSNAAADNLHVALKAAGVRAVRFQKEPTEECKISRTYISWCETQDAWQRFKTWKETLGHFSVVVTTCASAGHPVLDGIVFDALILDEATQSTEPSCLVPLGRGIQQCVLVGDPKQLPPTVYETPELQVTLFDRVDKVEPDNLKVYLDEQRRMHPDIMAFSNQQFYDGRLKTNVIPPVPAGWPKGAPRVIFKEVAGAEQSRGASKCNLKEVQAVKLEAMRLHMENPSQSIAVLTPYLAQKFLLKHALADIEVTVNTIDGYQGNEADVVLFSTVRSDKLGFTDDSRRMNVALTRARGGLIVFGRRKVMRTRPLWADWVRWVDELKQSDHRSTD